MSNPHLSAPHRGLSNPIKELSPKKTNSLIPYGRQWIDEEDIQAIVEVLRSDWLTQGPKVQEFEEAFARFVGTRYAVAVNSGTAALHCAFYSIGIGPGDEVIVPPITFAATANSVVFQGGTPIFVDVQPDTLLLDPDLIEEKITSKTKAIIAVDFAGHPCDYDRLKEISLKHGLALVADGCHALGALHKGKKVGSIADLTVFSFHPVKNITTGEGGMVTTDDPELAQRMRIFRNHGITTDHHQRNRQASWFYEMVDLGYNYRITDFQSALGLSQLVKLPDWTKRRRKIAKQYDSFFSKVKEIEPLAIREDIDHAYHLYVVQLGLSGLRKTRGEFFASLRAEGIGVNVHYIPVYLHPYYRDRFGTGPGLCPVAEVNYERILSLPIFPLMNQADIQRVEDAMIRIISG
jgi:perosamine synthetase